MIRAHGLAVPIAFLGALTPRTMTTVGDPPCPTNCSTECDLIPVEPVFSGSSCIGLTVVWTRKRDGCCTQGSTCRTCDGRVRVDAIATPECLASAGSTIKWNHFLQTQPGGEWAAQTPGMQGGFTFDPVTGNYVFVDVRDLSAGCGQAARYEGQFGDPLTVSTSAEFACDSCPP